MARLAERIYNITGPDSADIDCRCPRCGKEEYVLITEDEADALDAGALIQEVLPHRTVAEREQIVSQICPACQTNIF